MDAESVRIALRRSHFHIREADANGVHYIYGDRHRWTKLATLISHLGLILFLVAAAVTSRFGFESGIELTTGQSQPVQAIGTPGLLVVKSYGFSDPTAADGTVLDYTTDLAVYRDGQLLARKVIRVNDPLSVDGFTFHQNGFRPAPDLIIRDSKGQPLWNGAVPLDDTVAGSPHGTMSVPGEGNIGLEMLLTNASDGTEGVLFLPYRATGHEPRRHADHPVARPVLRGGRRRSAARPTPTSTSSWSASRTPRSWSPRTIPARASCGSRSSA